MRLPRMTTRRWMVALVFLGLAFWMGIALIRVQNDISGRWVYHLWEREGPYESRSVFETRHPVPYSGPAATNVLIR